LPQADVVSLITTGTLTSGDTSTSDSPARYRTATSLLTDVLINEPAQRATSKLFGLNRFEISPVWVDQASTPERVLTVGKRISKELSVSYSTNVYGRPEPDTDARISSFGSPLVRCPIRAASTRQISSRNNSFNFEIKIP